MRRRLGLVIILGALIGATVVLHQMARPFPVSALADGPLEVALGSAARLLGLTITYWLLTSTLLYLLASLAQIPRLLKAISPFTWRPVRRLIERGLASTVAIAMAVPTQASIVPGYVPVPASDPAAEPAATTLVIETTTTSASSALSQPPVVSPPIEILYLPIEPVPTTSVVTALGTAEAQHVVVMPGDNMWLLAERRLSDLLGRPAGDHEVAPYWLAVIGANKDRIRSGDPDLIFPGEVLVLPAWDAG